MRSVYIHSGYNRAEERTTGAERTGNVDCEHTYVRPPNLLSGRIDFHKSEPILEKWNAMLPAQIAHWSA